MVEKSFMKKWTWELVQKTVENKLPKWIINQKEPDIVRGTMKIKLLCPRGHKNEKSVTLIDREDGLGCSQCNKENKAVKCYSRYVEVLKKENWTMLSTVEEIMKGEKIASQTPLRVICPNGKPHLTSWNSFSQGSRCSCSICRPIKAGIKKGEKHKIKGIDDARERFRGKNLELLSDKWVGSSKKTYGKKVHLKYDVRCLICDYTRPVSPGAILYDENPCPVCSGHKGTLKTFTLWTKKNRPEFYIPQNQIYKGSMEDIKIVCIKHNETFDLRANDFKNGVNGCPICVFETKSEVTKKLHEQYIIDGNNHPYWNGLRRLYDHLREQLGDWKKLSLEANGYFCVITGEKLAAIHHTRSFKDIVLETIQVTGLPIYESIQEYSQKELKFIQSTCLKLHDFYGLGFPLSKESHSEFHSMYGNGGNTIDQFIVFLMKKGKEEFARKIKECDSERKKIMKIKYPEFSKLA